MHRRRSVILYPGAFRKSQRPSLCESTVCAPLLRGRLSAEIEDRKRECGDYNPSAVAISETEKRTAEAFRSSINQLEYGQVMEVSGVKRDVEEAFQWYGNEVTVEEMRKRNSVSQEVQVFRKLCKLKSQTVPEAASVARDLYYDVIDGSTAIDFFRRQFAKQHELATSGDALDTVRMKHRVSNSIRNLSVDRLANSELAKLLLDNTSNKIGKLCQLLLLYLR